MPYWKDIGEIKKNFVIGNKSLNGYEHNVLFRNDGSRFTEIGHVAGPDSVFDSRSVIAADFDSDGDQDLVVSTLMKPLLYYQNNVGSQQHSVELRLESQESLNRNAIGAQVRLLAGGRERLMEVTAGNSFLAQASPRLFAGLGATERIDLLEIHWPARRNNGTIRRDVQTLRDLPADGVLTIRQGEETPVFTPFRTPRLKSPSRPVENSAKISKLRDLDGRNISFRRGNGTIQVVNVWASWCGPCKTEMPALNALHDEWKDQGVRILGVTFEDSVERVKKSVWENGLRYPIAMAPSSFADELETVNAIPYTIIYDRKGQERFRKAGVIEKDQVAALLRKLTAEAR